MFDGNTVLLGPGTEIRANRRQYFTDRYQADLQPWFPCISTGNKQQVIDKTGGPFGSAVFDTSSGRLIAAGVNLVVASSMATAHAEMVAIAMAGIAIDNHDLATVGETQLVATTEPCAMCLGAVGWSGVTSAVFGARDEDARAVGFDEGTKPERWAEGLEAAGIEVRRDVRREEAAAVLRSYAESGGMIYNGRAALDKMGD